MTWRGEEATVCVVDGGGDRRRDGRRREVRGRFLCVGGEGIISISTEVYECEWEV